MIEKAIQEIIDKLIKGTKLKKINWERTERKSEFKVELGSSVVTTDNWLLETGVECVDLALWNSKGEVAKRVAYENNEAEGADFNTLLELYSLAKNSYFQVDDTIAEIMSHLDFKD